VCVRACVCVCVSMSVLLQVVPFLNVPATQLVQMEGEDEQVAHEPEHATTTHSTNTHIHSTHTAHTQHTHSTHTALHTAHTRTRKCMKTNSNGNRPISSQNIVRVHDEMSVVAVPPGHPTNEWPALQLAAVCAQSAAHRSESTQWTHITHNT